MEYLLKDSTEEMMEKMITELEELGVPRSIAADYVHKMYMEIVSGLQKWLHDCEKERQGKEDER